MLSQKEIKQTLKNFSGNWKIENNKLVLNITLGNFGEAVKMINRIAEIAEEHEHHPDLRLYGYKNLEITLYSHDQNQVTQKDLNLAEKISKLINDRK